MTRHWPLAFSIVLAILSGGLLTQIYPTLSVEFIIPLAIGYALLGFVGLYAVLLMLSHWIKFNLKLV